MADSKARIWTIEELTRVHPLPEGWAWELWDDGKIPVAVARGVRRWVTIGDGRVVCADDDGPLFHPLAAVVEAVTLASKGLDSLAEMAAALDTRAETSLGKIAGLADAGRHERAYHADGVACGLRESAAMVRRGKVNP